ncbi:MAG: Mth938-like domain-containing protein [Proteobacteria bacterium]|nr:Mth938-like domain-containing protein [Pseudomonadota bacterium]
MPFVLNRPDHAYFVRSVTDTAIVVNDRALTRSFYLSPDALHESWPPSDAAALTPADLLDPLALRPEVLLLGTGQRQVFPSADVLAACLTRGIGIEVMTNAAAARTFSVLASEGRKVIAAFLLAQD